MEEKLKREERRKKRTTSGLPEYHFSFLHLQQPYHSKYAAEYACHCRIQAESVANVMVLAEREGTEQHTHSQWIMLSININK